MSTPIALERRGRLPLSQRIPALLAVETARVVSALPPRYLYRFLRLIRNRAVAATEVEVHTARDMITTASLRCAGEYCVQRSVATALLCRIHGVWPTWCVGVRTAPFTAHAWVAVGDNPIGEPYIAGDFQPIMTVEPTTVRGGENEG
ncbi:lasso peptide biosynthesis B2 protein [Nocardia terpenica]|uniref:lasso peptide biosynthesis B2 protein n=1 Tax=Nocardia terpenica TaxID=455432 RepID=UPI0009EDD5A5|nr:lasso peptide biosynthesis B2 protein [Nocardia terpenica]